MLLIRFDGNKVKRVTDMDGMLRGACAFLVGGSPGLKTQPIALLSSRGVTTMAINNAALHFRPTLWIGGDTPQCYAKQILMDPAIMKFAPYAHRDAPVGALPWRKMPNTYFYTLAPNVSYDDFLSPRSGVPWYNATIYCGIYVLYSLGVRTIILAGSEFGLGTEDAMYANDSKLTKLEQKWNVDLYNNAAKDLRMLKPVFDRSELTLMDCSTRSRISPPYRHLTMEDAIAYCLRGFPIEEDVSNLPHCSRFVSDKMREGVAQWPGFTELSQDGFMPVDDTVKPAGEEVL